MAYEVRVKRSAEKEFKNLPEQMKRRIGEALTALGDNPFPNNVKKLQNRDDYRIRVGDYRVLYSVNESEKKINVSAIGHRKDVYR
ncbi:MAG: type II toxin-antitoxin system RelE/ParE family toxin [Leptospiraceae bacterium]|nr:type II toxin-antitoxin system RelE/ParE family toxin [Leptospiraceae bacterium]MCB1314563.1 type II toxin-antitoxin system RelE/ParE family toxin [Leptospiraceae bacterium]